MTPRGFRRGVTALLGAALPMAACLVPAPGFTKDVRHEPSVRQDPSARQEQLRAQEHAADPRCASEGAGFFYSSEAHTCVRVGGLVGVQGSAGIPR